MDEIGADQDLRYVIRQELCGFKADLIATVMLMLNSGSGSSPSHTDSVATADAATMTHPVTTAISRVATSFRTPEAMETELATPDLTRMKGRRCARIGMGSYHRVRELSCDYSTSEPSTSEIAARKRLFRRRDVVGSAPRDSRLSPCSRAVELFISNVSKQASLDDVRNFVASQVEVLELGIISHPAAFSQSFLLRVHEDRLEEVLHPSFWPERVRCRKFVRPATGRLAEEGV